MDIMQIEKMRNELLDRMAEDFKEAYIAAGVAEPETAGAPRIVRTILDEIGSIGDDAIGEYYFTPFQEDDEVQFFNALITMTEEIPRERLPQLFEVMSYINFSIPSGSFAIDRDLQFFSYRLTIPMPVDFSGEQVYELMNIAAGNSAAIVDAYMGVFMDVAEGRMSVEEVLDLLGGRREG